MGRIELITAAALAATAAFFIVPTGQAAPLSTATPTSAVERTTEVRPAPTVRVVYPSPYAVPAAKGAR
jgi:hypothetical protein